MQAFDKGESLQIRRFEFLIALDWNGRLDRTHSILHLTPHYCPV
jgi:hypothetical protein